MTTHDKDKIIAAAKEAGFIYYGEFPQDYKCKIEALYAIAFEDGASRYNELRRGQHWSVLDGIGNVLRGDDLDVAVDRAIRARGEVK